MHMSKGGSGGGTRCRWTMDARANNCKAGHGRQTDGRHRVPAASQHACDPHVDIDRSRAPRLYVHDRAWIGHGLLGRRPRCLARALLILAEPLEIVRTTQLQFKMRPNGLERARASPNARRDGNWKFEL